uniref:Uncharacterized protein n=1 Tax=viral metagenome TaxID=1070528 RepID=A0A2V0RB55_9ZZZZ
MNPDSEFVSNVKKAEQNLNDAAKLQLPLNLDPHLIDELAKTLCIFLSNHFGDKIIHAKFPTLKDLFIRSKMDAQSGFPGLNGRLVIKRKVFIQCIVLLLSLLENCDKATRVYNNYFSKQPSHVLTRKQTKWSDSKRITNVKLRLVFNVPAQVIIVHLFLWLIIYPIIKANSHIISTGIMQVEISKRIESLKNFNTF